MINLTDNSFVSLLQRHRAGGLMDDASRKLAEVVAGVKATGKTGSLTLKLVVKPAQRGHGAVFVTDDVKIKAPSMEAEASFWFATDGGALAKDNPDQKQLPFEPKAVDGGATPETVPVQPAQAAVGQ